MARRVKGSLQLLIDTDSVAKFIGAGEALSESVRDVNYLDAIIDAAHNETEIVFNNEAAAAAAAGANIKHMFEWGTLGINRGRTDMRPQPTSERARLWTTVMTGRGLNRKLTYTFKPSLAIVPKPTVRDTGMDPDVINSLEDHVFKWKAEVLETGSPVTIKPINGDRLLIPYYPSQWGSRMFSDYDIERGFTLSKGPHTHSPGDTAGTTGTFTKFWSGWWESTGEKLMNESVEKQIRTDFFPELTVNYSPNNPELPVVGTFKAKVEKEKTNVKRAALVRARTRRKTT